MKRWVLRTASRYRASVSGGETHFLRDGEVYRDTGRNHAALFGSFEEESLRSSPPSTLFRWPCDCHSLDLPANTRPKLRRSGHKCNGVNSKTKGTWGKRCRESWGKPGKSTGSGHGRQWKEKVKWREFQNNEAAKRPLFCVCVGSRKEKNESVKRKDKSR